MKDPNNQLYSWNSNHFQPQSSDQIHNITITVCYNSSLWSYTDRNPTKTIPNLNLLTYYILSVYYHLSIVNN